MKRIALSLIGVLTIFVALSSHAGDKTATASAESLIPAAARKLAPDFALTDAQGQTVSLAARKGKVVLLDFWATWCGGCKLEIPWYMQFDQTYRGRGLAAIGASMDSGGWKSVRPFLARKHDDETGGNIDMRYPVVIATPELAKAYNVTSMPVTVLIDRQGRIALTHVGVVDRGSFETNIETLLAQH